VPVAISTSTGGIDQIVATAPLVRNEIPDGSTWDGKTDLPMDEATFHQMLTEIEPGSNGSSPASAAPAGAGAKAPSSTPPESARPTAKVGT
jgi:hypothetical protein